MRFEQNPRRSTSALLYDDNEKILDAMTDQQPLLGYTDIDDVGMRQSWYRRIYARYVVAIWVFLGFICLYMLRVNLSVAIVAMTVPQSLKNESVEACPSNTNDSSDTPTKVP
ncbi:unnamed protein product [Rotaria sp. Silwood1]|nr:unnamed protein product [Rotaria sp. Silwood1]